MRKSLTLKTIRQLDKSNMLDLLLDFPMQCLVAQQIAEKTNILFGKEEIKKIVFAGMGGSSIGGSLVRSYLYLECPLPILVVREYDLSSFVDEQTLVFISSYSGNTEETLSTYTQAKAKGAKIIVISSGGRLREFALNDKLTFVAIPPNLPPRTALGYLSITPLCLLSKMGIIEDKDSELKEAQTVLKELKVSLNPKVALKENLAKYVASRVFNKFVVIYSASMHFDCCAERFRTQLNENAKTLASHHVFPEMNHNEIVGWQNPKKIFTNFVVVMLRDKLVHPRVGKRMDITKQILKKESLEILEIWSKGKSLLSRMLSLIYIGDFLSFYLAILYGVDPNPVDRVTYLKKRLAEQ